MGFIFYGFSAGLVLFWLTGNVVGIGQQLILEPVPPDRPRATLEVVEPPMPEAQPVAA